MTTTRQEAERLAALIEAIPRQEDYLHDDIATMLRKLAQENEALRADATKLTAGFVAPDAFAILHHDDGYFTTKVRDSLDRTKMRTEVFTLDQLRAAYAAGAAAQLSSESVGYLAWRDGKPDWSEDCVCEDAVYPRDSDDESTSMPIYTKVTP